MTEFDRWRLARQEADQLLQQLRDGHDGGAARGAQPAPVSGERRHGLAQHAAAVRDAALRLLRPRAR